MYLTSLTLRDFAGLAKAELSGLSRGLNVVVGNNEAGKSTLLMALRAAFFQKHRTSGEAARALAPYDRTARPEIKVCFETGGVAYTLEKGFIQRPEATLVWPGGSLSSDAVEERLAELLGFAHPGRGESKLSEHQGAFGLLWVEQGRSHGQDLDLGVGKNAVTASLEGEVGQLLGGDRGRALLAAAKQRQDRFFTDTLRTAKGSPLKEAEEALARLEAEGAIREAARRDYDGRIERLRAIREALAAYDRDAVLAAAKRAEEAARARLAGLEGLRRDVESSEAELDHAEGRRARAGDILAQREALILEAQAGAAKAAAAGETLAETAAESEAAAGRLAEALAALDAARAALDAAEAAADAAERARERGASLERLSALVERRVQAKAVAVRLAGLRAARRPDAPDARALAAIEAAERSRREAEIRQGAAALVVRFEPEGEGEGAAAETEDGRPAASFAAVRVVAETTFRLPGFGRMTVTPGGGASDLEAARRAAEGDLARLLARHGIPSVEAARALVRAEEERAGAERGAAAELKAIAPEGLSALEDETGALEARLAALPPPPAAPRRDGDGEDVRRRRDGARDAVRAAENRLQLVRADLAARQARRVRAEADLDHAAGQADRLGARLSESEAARPAPALREDLAAAELDRSAKAAVRALRRAALAEADPEVVRLEALRAASALDALGRDIAALERDGVALEAEVRALGLQNLGEDLERITGEIETLRDKRRRLALEADAARLLHTVLCTAQREAREHWLGPIKTQVAPYLRLIQPEGRIELDEATLEIRSLHRRGVEEDFKRLSAGAREQVAVVTRLALAEVLKRGGHPAAVILDDALVNTDEERLQRMHLVLQKAAEGLQIIVLTCRARDFHGLGAPIFRL